MPYEQLVGPLPELHDPSSTAGVGRGQAVPLAVFFHSPEQSRVAASREGARAGFFKETPIVTEIEPATTFWRAEDYLQNYLEKRGLATCRI